MLLKLDCCLLASTFPRRVESGNPDYLEVDPETGHEIKGGEIDLETDQEIRVPDKAAGDLGPGDIQIPGRESSKHKEVQM